MKDEFSRPQPKPEAGVLRAGALKLMSIAKNEVLRKLLTPVAVGEAGNLTADAKTGDFSSITQLARQSVEKIRQARGQ